jgi:branched-chain amino acid transport system substrate-binding protein
MTSGHDDRSLDRRRFLGSAGAAAAGAALGFPTTLRAQAPSFKVGIIHPVTGPLAQAGRECRLGAQLAADAINAAGGINSLGGMKLDLLLGDTQSTPEVGRAEADRLVNQGAQVLMGSFDSGSTAAIVPLAQQRRVPFLIDVAAADPITANVAGAVREGQQKIQYVYRNFPTSTSLVTKAVQYFSEIFRAAGVSPRRVVLMHCNDLFGQTSARGFQAAHAATKPPWEIVDVIAWTEPALDLSTEVSRAKAARPDVIAPITRRASAQLLLPEIRKQRLDVRGIVGHSLKGRMRPGRERVKNGSARRAARRHLPRRAGPARRECAGRSRCPRAPGAPAPGTLARPGCGSRSRPPAGAWP